MRRSNLRTTGSAAASSKDKDKDSKTEAATTSSAANSKAKRLAAAAEAAAAEAAAAEARLKAKPLRIFSNAGPVTCVCVNQAKGDLLCAGTAHGDIAVIASDVADPVLAEEAGGNAEPVAPSSMLRNAHRKKVSAITCDAQGRFVTGSGDGSVKLWSVDPTVSLFPVCVKTLFPADYAAELERPVVAPLEKKFEVPEVTAVVVSDHAITNSETGEPETVVFCGYSDGALRKWNADREQCVQLVRPALGRVTSLATGCGLLVAGSDCGLVSAFTSGDTKEAEAVQCQWPEPVRALAVVSIYVPPTSLKNANPPPATIVFAGTPSGTIYGFDVATGHKKCALKHFGNSGTGDGNAAVACLVAGPNCLLSAHDNGCVVLWNVLGWTAVGTFWHSAVEGRTSVLSAASLFELTAAAGDAGAGTGVDAASSAAGANSPAASSVAASVTRSGSLAGSMRPGSAAATAAAASLATRPPAPKVAMVTAAMAGSIHVWTACVNDAIEKLHNAEVDLAQGVIAQLKAKRAEEKANKRRL